MRGDQINQNDRRNQNDFPNFLSNSQFAMVVTKIFDHHVHSNHSRVNGVNTAVLILIRVVLGAKTEWGGKRCKRQI